MKVWLLLSRLENGGLERVQVNLAQEMRTRLVDVSIVAGQVNPDFIGELPPTIQITEIAPRGPIFFPIALWRNISAAKPDIIFTTSNDVACLAVLMQRFYFNQTKVVVTQHLSLSGPIKQARGVRRVKLSLIRRTMQWLLPKADQVVAVSHSLAADLCETTGISPDRIRVIHNPVIATDFPKLLAESYRLPWTEKSPIIVFVGRLSSEKRLDLLWQAFLASRRNHKTRLVVVGSGPMEIWLKERIGQSNLAGECHLTGFLGNVYPVLRQMDLLVLASDYEGFGNVLVEAMACGVQVVATDCPNGPAEILDHGRLGQLVPTGDAIALGDAVERCLTGNFRVPPELLRKRAMEFSVERAAQLYMDVLNRAAGTVA